MVTGRPTKYNPNFIILIEDYLKTCGREQTKLPKREDVAILLDVNDDTLVEWEKIHPEFSATIKKVDKLQKATLMDDGMYGGKEVNSSMAIFLLKANHKMVETQHTDITSGGDKIEGLTIYRPEKKK